MDFEGYVIFSGIQIVLPNNILLVNFGEKYEPRKTHCLSMLLRLKHLIPGFFLLLNTLLVAQAPMRKLPLTINHPSINVSAPFISTDGNTLLYLSDYAEDGVLTVYFTQRTGADWKDPAALPKHINNRLNYLRGYALSADGKTLYITSIKSGGVGGYDIWHGSLRSNSWNELENMYMPINSKGHEGCPSLTPDGNTIYFMRCENMDAQRASTCRLLVARKNPAGQWMQPEELPDYINTGNSQCPRIMADGETLLFSSDRLSPNKGGMDLYMTRLEKNTWSKPVPLTFANTENDDQFVSVTSSGRYLLRDVKGKSKTEIVELLFPDDLRPRGVMKVEGQVRSTDGVLPPAYISVNDLITGKPFFNGRPDKDGSFTVYLREGTRYELVVEPEDGQLTYYSSLFDLTNNADLNTRKIQVALRPLVAGDELELESMRFDPSGYRLKDEDNEIARLARLIKHNPRFRFELQVLLEGYAEDSIPSRPDLTEVAADSVWIKLTTTDSIGQVVERDSLVIKQKWHNDRTRRQADEIIRRLIQQGVPPSSITVFTRARPGPGPEAETRVRLTVRNKP